MSRDQKPGKSSIVVNAPTGDTTKAMKAAAPSSTLGTTPPAAADAPLGLLAALFAFASICSAIGFVLLPGLRG